MIIRLVENQIIYLNDFKFDVFELLLEFMYFGEVTMERREQSIELHKIAKFFQVEFLKDKNHYLPINENNEYFEPKEETLKLELNDIQETVLIDYTSTDLETSVTRQSSIISHPRKSAEMTSQSVEEE